ncbi:hypothetical protein D3C84_1026840 [compost metagenome]
MADALSGETAPLQSGQHRRRRQRGQRGVFKRTAEGADCGSYGTGDVNFGSGHRSLRRRGRDGRGLIRLINNDQEGLGSEPAWRKEPVSLKTGPVRAYAENSRCG